MPPFNSLNVSIGVAIVLIVIVCYVVYQLMKMQDAYKEQRTEFARVISIVKDFKQIQPGMIALLQRLDSVGKDCEAQKTSLQELDKRVEAQEAHVSQNEVRISELVDEMSHFMQEVGRKTQIDSSLMRKGILSQDVELRFNMLSEWLAKNSLAILRRAGHSSRKAEDLITIIPASLEPVAEIVNDHVLLVGTRGHPDRHAIMLDDSDPNSDAAPVTERKLSPRRSGLLLSHPSPALEREKIGTL